MDSFVASWWTTTLRLDELLPTDIPATHTHTHTHTHTRIFPWRQTSCPFMRFKNVKKRGKHNIEKVRYKLQIYFRCWIYNFIDFAWLVYILQIWKKYKKKTKLLSQRPVDSCVFMLGLLTVASLTNTFAFLWRAVTSVAIKLAAGEWFVRK